MKKKILKLCLPKSLIRIILLTRRTEKVLGDPDPPAYGTLTLPLTLVIQALK